MRPVVKGATPFTIGLQNNKIPLPMSMKLTCCCWLTSAGIFTSYQYNIQHLAAAGTDSGQIILLDVQKNSIQYVALMCGHSCKVTDLIQNDQNTFSSISVDGTICVWSISDAICIFTSNFTSIYAEYKFSASFINSETVYIWSDFGTVYLVNVTTGNIEKTYSFPGLLSFSPTNWVNLIIVSKISSFDLYSVGENGISCNNLTKTFFDIHDIRICTPYGVVRYGERRITFIDIIQTKTLGSMVLTSINDDDQLIDAVWTPPFHIFATFRSGIIYEFNLDSEGKVKLHKVATATMGVYCSSIKMNFPPPKAPPLIKLNKDEPKQEENTEKNYDIIYVNSKMNLVYINNEGNEIQLVRNNNSRIFAVPDMKHPMVIKTSGKKSLKLFNWTAPSITSPAFKTDSSITAIKCRHIPTHGMQIIVGAENGTVSFFWAEKRIVSQRVLALNSPVVAFVDLSFSNAGKFILFALGKDGSFAVFNFFDLMETYISNGFPITAVYAMIKQELVIIRRSDNSLYVYSLNEPEPVEIISTLPKDAEQVYPATASKLEFHFPSTRAINIGGGGYYYSSLTLNNLENEVMGTTNHLQRNSYISLLTVYYHLLQPVSKSQSFGLLKDSISTDLSQFTSDNVADPDVDTNDLSFCLIGTNNIPTFFYPLYTLSGMGVYDISSYQASLHFIASNVIGSILSSDCSIRAVEVSFVQVMVRFLESDDPIIRQIASLSCARSASVLHLERATNIMEQFGELKSIDGFGTPDLLLLSMVVIAEDSFIPKIFHRRLFEFLLRVSTNDDDVASLALIILIDGYTTWGMAIGNRQMLMNSIVARMLMYKRPDHVQRTFAIAAGSDIATYFKVFEQFVKNEETDLSPDVLVQRLFTLTTLVSFTNKHTVGALGSYYIACVGNDYPRLADIAMQELKKHAQKLENVDVNGKFVIIGTQDGCVSLFKKSTIVFSEQFFRTPVVMVSIGPEGLAAVAAARDETNAIVFTTKRSGILSKKPKIISQIPAGLHPVWKSPYECNLTD